MRRIRYSVAMSLDGFIAAPNEEIDWIEPDPEVDFAALWAQFDTFLMGRRTYEIGIRMMGEKAFRGMKVFVFSRTLKQLEHPRATLLSELNGDWVRGLKAESGRDIWLFGGGAMFRSFLDARLVDTVEVNLVPVLLGDGVPLLPPPYTPAKLNLLSHNVSRSGRVSLVYEIRQ